MFQASFYFFLLVLLNHTHHHLQKTALAPICPLFKCSNENTNELRLAFYFLREIPNLKRKKKKRKREDDKFAILDKTLT